MNVTRRTWLHSGTALNATLASHYAYDIPSDQPKAAKVPAHIVERGRELGLQFGALAVVSAAGRA